MNRLKITTVRRNFLSGVMTVIVMASVPAGIASVISIAVLDAHIEATAAHAVSSTRISRTRAGICKELYNDGTGQWLQCMGLGKR